MTDCVYAIIGACEIQNCYCKKHVPKDSELGNKIYIKYLKKEETDKINRKKRLSKNRDKRRKK